MKKKLGLLLSVLLVLLLAIPTLPTQAINNLNGVELPCTYDSSGKYRPGERQYQELEGNPEIVVLGDPAHSNEWVFWHFTENNDNTRTKITLGYRYKVDGGGYNYVEVTMNSYAQTGKNEHFGVVTPKDWELCEAYCVDHPTWKFQLSHTERFCDDVPHAKLTVAKKFDTEFPLEGSYEVLLTNVDGGHSVSFILNAANQYTASEYIRGGNYGKYYVEEITKDPAHPFVGFFVDGKELLPNEDGQYIISVPKSGRIKLVVVNHADENSSDPCSSEDSSECSEPSSSEDSSECSDPSSSEDSSECSEPSSSEDSSDSSEPSSSEDSSDSSEPSSSEPQDGVYDAALRKWVSKVVRGSVTAASHDDPGAVATGAVPAERGDKVTFSIKLFNQGAETVILTSISDYKPAGYDFSEADNFGWTMVTGDLLTYDVPIELEKGEEHTITLVLTVNNTATKDTLDNAAEISGMTDKEGLPVTDSDSTPDSNSQNDTCKDNIIDEDGKAEKQNDEDDHDIALVTLTGYIEESDTSSDEHNLGNSSDESEEVSDKSSSSSGKGVSEEDDESEGSRYKGASDEDENEIPITSAPRMIGGFLLGVGILAMSSIALIKRRRKEV